MVFLLYFTIVLMSKPLALHVNFHVTTAETVGQQDTVETVRQGFNH